MAEARAHAQPVDGLDEDGARECLPGHRARSHRAHNAPPRVRMSLSLPCVDQAIRKQPKPAMRLAAAPRSACTPSTWRASPLARGGVSGARSGTAPLSLPCPHRPLQRPWSASSADASAGERVEPRALYPGALPSAHAICSCAPRGVDVTDIWSTLRCTCGSLRLYLRPGATLIYFLVTASGVLQHAAAA